MKPAEEMRLENVLIPKVVLDGATRDTSGFSKIDYRKKTYTGYASWSRGKGLVNEVVNKILEVCT